MRNAALNVIALIVGLMIGLHFNQPNKALTKKAELANRAAIKFKYSWTTARAKAKRLARVNKGLLGELVRARGATDYWCQIYENTYGNVSCED